MEKGEKLIHLVPPLEENPQQQGNGFLNKLIMDTSPENLSLFEGRVSSMSAKEAASFLIQCGRNGIGILAQRLHPGPFSSFFEKISEDTAEDMIEKMEESEIIHLKEKIDDIKNRTKKMEAFSKALGIRLIAQKEFHAIEGRDPVSFLEAFTVGRNEDLVEFVKNVNERQRLVLLEKINEVIRKRGFILIDYSMQTFPLEVEKKVIVDVIENLIKFIKIVRVAEEKGLAVGSKDTDATNFIIPPRVEMRGALEDFIRARGMDIIPPPEMAFGQNEQGILDESGMMWVRILYEFVGERWGFKEANKIIAETREKIERKEEIMSKEDLSI